MTHVIATPIDAVASLTPNAWGTRTDLRCSYPAQPDRWAGSYLVVIDHAGHAQQAASWKPVPGVESTIAASTDLTVPTSPRSKSAPAADNSSCDYPPEQQHDKALWQGTSGRNFSANPASRSQHAAGSSFPAVPAPGGRRRTRG
jgi:hypothetical protein